MNYLEKRKQVMFAINSTEKQIKKIKSDLAKKKRELKKLEVELLNVSQHNLFEKGGA